VRIVGIARQPKPPHVHRRAEAPRPQPHCIPQRRRAAVTRDRQVGEQLADLSFGVAVADPDHSFFARRPADYRRQHLGAAQQPKRWFLLRGGRKQLEEIPLRDQRNVLVRTGNSAQIDADLRALDLHVQRVDLAVRHPGEFVGQT
jgi:hypothetical protein